MPRRWRFALVGVLVALLVPVSAWAVSDGDYSPSQQGCSPNADDYNQPGAQSGCHNSRVVVSDGGGDQLFTVGTDQTANGQTVSNADYTFTPGAFDPTSGARVYFGADDNLDQGEHDASPQWQNGPSDGGGVHADATPALAFAWLDGVMAAIGGNPGYLLTHPLPVDAGYGACADGTCASVQTNRRVVFQGGSSGSRDAANYSGVTWDPYNCSSGDQQSQTPQACGGHSLRWWNQQQGTVYAEPGAQVYEDPDAQASPALPIYPIPSAYAGTCGVIAGGGPVPQAAVSTGC